MELMALGLHVTVIIDPRASKEKESKYPEVY